MMSDVIGGRRLERNPREGWSTDSQRIAEAGDDVLVWPEFGNDSDTEPVWDDDGS